MTTGTSTPTGGRTAAGFRGGIEALRGIAAVSVVVHHSWSLSTMPRFPGYVIVEGLGTWGVTLFFLLSGYLLADQFWVARPATRLRGYWVRRIFRIAPAYYITVGLLFLFFANHDLLFSAQGVRQVLANATFTHYLWPNTSSSFNVDGALWTLTIELLLYVALPFIAIPFGRRPVTTFLVTAGLGLGWRLVIALHGDGLRALYFPHGGPATDVESLFLARQFPGVLPVFAVGIGLKWLVVKHEPTRRLLDRLPAMTPWHLVVALLPSLAALLCVERASAYTHWVWFTLFDMGVAVLLALPLFLAGAPRWQSGLPSSRVTQWVGERSYSLYIWHFPIILSIYGRGPLENPPQLSWYPVRALMIATLALVAAHLSYTLIEVPGISLGKRLARKVQPAAPEHSPGPTHSTLG